jgi:hypothetical protein
MANIAGTVTSKSRTGTGIQIDKGQWYNGSKEQLAGIAWKDEVELEADDGRKIISIKLTSDRDKAASGGSINFGDRQNAIEWQSSRRDAITIALGFVEQGLVAVPKAEAAKFDAIMGLIDTITLRLYNTKVPERNSTV